MQQHTAVPIPALRPRFPCRLHSDCSDCPVAASPWACACRDSSHDRIARQVYSNTKRLPGSWLCLIHSVVESHGKRMDACRNKPLVADSCSFLQIQMSPGAFGLEHRSFAATRLEDIAKVTAR